MQKLTLSVLPEKLGICHIGKSSPIPSWADEAKNFCSITRTPTELSIVCEQDKIPAGIMVEKDWRAFKLEGPIEDLSIFSVGIIASLAGPLAKAGISILDISTFETDYILVEEKNLEKAINVLSEFCTVKQ